jgi:TP901 family phage tail tape measure protein
LSTGKTFALAIALKATIDSSIAAGIAKAAQSIQNVAQTANAVNAQMDKGTAALRGYESELANIGAKSAQFMTLKRAIQDNSNSLTEARARASALASQFKASEQETAALKARVDQAKESLERMKGTLTPATYKAAKAEIKSLSAAYRESEERTKALGSDFEEAKNKAAKLKDTLANQQATLQGVRSSLSEAGISTKNFAESQRTAQEALEKTIAKEKEAIAHRERMAGLREKRQGASDKFSAAKGNFLEATLMAGAIAAPLIEATHEAIQFESVMADVKKVVDFDTPEQFKAMSGDILKLSTELPMAAEGIAQIVAAGGQSGIAREDLLSFAESATKMGIAFDITADQAGDMMAKWRTAFKMNQEEVVALADKVNYLGNTTAASAPLISEVVTRIGPLGEVGGVASGEIAALGASIVGTGTSSEIAATGIKNLILGMSAGAGATKTQAAAFASLGMTAEDVASRMQVDAKGAIIDVMKAIQALDADKQAATLQDLFGKESIGAIAPLLGNLENLQENFDKVADATKYAGSMEQEYAARSQTTENQIQLAKNTLDAVAVTIGSALLPAVGQVFASIAPVLTSIAEWASRNEELVVIIAGVAAGIAALIVTIAGMTLIVQGAALAYASFQLAAEFVKGLQLATKIATAAQWAWNAAMTANPIGIVIIAIAALIGILYVLYTHFEEVQEFCASVWESPAAAVIAFITGPIGMLIYCVAGIIANWETVKEWFSLLWENPSAAIGQFVSFLQSKLGEGITWAQEKWEALREVLSHPIDAVVNFIRGGDSAASDAAGVDISENAIGGIYKKGAFLTTFAENSPEAAIPINGSARAASLWRQTGEMMGLLPKETAEIIPQATEIQESTAQAPPPMLTLVPPLPRVAQEATQKATEMQEHTAKTQSPMLSLVPPITQTIQNAAPQLEASAPILQMQAPPPMQSPTIAAMPSPSGGVNITFNPTIHIDGTADAGVVEQLRSELERQKQELIAMLPTLLKRQDAHERRLSYA